MHTIYGADKSAVERHEMLEFFVTIRWFQDRNWRGTGYPQGAQECWREDLSRILKLVCTDKSEING